MRLRVVERETQGNLLKLGTEVVVLEPTLFSYLVNYQAPLTGGGETLLLPGVKLIVTGLPQVYIRGVGKKLTMGRTVYFEFSAPELESMYIDPVVGILDHAKEEMRALYNGYNLYLEAEI